MLVVENPFNYKKRSGHNVNTDYTKGKTRRRKKGLRLVRELILMLERSRNLLARLHSIISGRMAHNNC